MVRTRPVCLDTHAVVWLVGGQTEKIGKEARSLIASAELLISPAVQLELQLLYEIGRVDAPADVATRQLVALNIQVATDPFDNVVSSALAESWTRDPFDRLIVAHARLLGATLLSRDRRITQAYPDTRW